MYVCIYTLRLSFFFFFFFVIFLFDLRTNIHCNPVTYVKKNDQNLDRGIVGLKMIDDADAN